MLIAQALGEYAGGSGGGLGATLATSFEKGMTWLQLSWRDDRSLWVGAIVCVLLGMWFFRRR